MANQDKKEQFIEYRIKGMTFENIAKKLKVSKQTLINWSKEDDIKETISKAKLMAYQSLLKQYEVNRDAKIKHLLELTNNIKAELAKRSLSDVPTDKLVKMLFNNYDRLSVIVPTKMFGGEMRASAVFENLFEEKEQPKFIFNPED